MRFAPPLTVPALVISLALATTSAHAADPLGIYLGGSVGDAQVQADGGSFTSAVFSERHTAFKGMAGLRPIELLGAEVEYFDFGTPTGPIGSFNTQTPVRMRGAAAFGLVYLPVPIIDLFAKAGLARLRSTVGPIQYTGPAPLGTGMTCVIGVQCSGLPRFDRNDTKVALGIGAQHRFGSLAVRGEFERFTAAGGKPTLLSLGVTWGF